VGENPRESPRKIQRSKSRRGPLGKEIDFVKVHAGWDELVFIYGDQLPKGREVKISLEILRKPSIRGIEVGILYPPAGAGDLLIKMIDDTTQGFIPMCGGITQGIGKAIVETSIGEYFGIETSEGKNRVVLETDSGLIPIEIEVKNHRAQYVVTDMQSYVRDRYEHGVGIIDVEGISCVNVGVQDKANEYLALDVAELSKRYPDVNFWNREKATLDALERIYTHFLHQQGLPLACLYGIVYEVERTEPPKSVRTVFRFYPWDYAPGDDLEFGCGTGTVSIGMALQRRGQVDFSSGKEELTIHVGGEHLPEDFRVRTRLILEGNKQKVTGAWFSHDRIELVASGKVYLRD
jgi:hypothetical protein